MARYEVTLAIIALVSCLAPALGGGYYTGGYYTTSTVVVATKPCPSPPKVTVTTVDCSPPKVTLVKVPAPPEPCEPDAPDAPAPPEPTEPESPEEPCEPDAPVTITTTKPCAPPTTVTVVKKPPTGVAYEKPPTTITTVKKPPTGVAYDKPPAPKKSPPPTITTTKKSPPPVTTTVGFPYCVCNRAAANPYTVSAPTAPAAGTFCITVSASGATPSWDLRKIELDINPACKGAVKSMTFGGKKVSPSYATYPAQKATVVKATYGTGNLASYSSIQAKPADLCVTLSAACATPDAFCAGGACKLAFFNPTKSSCPIITLGA